MFLETIVLGNDLNNSVMVNGDIQALSLLSGLIIFGVIFLIFLIFLVGSYIYVSLAYSKIARKAKRKDGAIAWIPLIGKPLLASRIAKMGSWPIWFLLSWLLVPFIYLANNILVTVFSILFIIGGMITFAVFNIIWIWKMFEAVGRPGWWVLLIFVPQIGSILYFVFLGIAAWGGEGAVVKRKDGITQRRDK